VVAQNLAFDTATIALPAGQEATLAFDNRDAGVQHNILIATDSSLTTQLFSGELITGPATADYFIPALEAGEYYFLCLVHPNMNGTVTVA
jgi:plastocyanin